MFKPYSAGFLSVSGALDIVLYLYGQYKTPSADYWRGFKDLKLNLIFDQLAIKQMKPNNLFQ
jgi:hypothetical protein